MTSYQILYWHDIPLQVRVLGEQRRDRITQPLAPRFQIAIDQAAMAAGVTTDDAYAEGFRWSEPQARVGTTEELLNAVVAEIEAQYAVIDWRATAARLKSD